MDDPKTPEAHALDWLHSERKSWPAVADYLNGFTQPDQPISPALAWKVANGRCSSTRVTLALVHANIIKRPPPKVEVEVCLECGHVHDQLRTCPGKKKRDPRRRRAWAGTPGEAKVVDEIVRVNGFDSLSQMVGFMVDEHKDGRTPLIGHSQATESYDAELD